MTTIFLHYAREDERIGKHVSDLLAGNVEVVSYYTHVLPGAFRQEARETINSWANAALILVSASFTASDELMGEVGRFMRQRQDLVLAGRFFVLKVRYCLWEARGATDRVRVLFDGEVADKEWKLVKALQEMLSLIARTPPALPEPGVIDVTPEYE